MSFFIDEFQTKNGVFNILQMPGEEDYQLQFELHRAYQNLGKYPTASAARDAVVSQDTKYKPWDDLGWAEEEQQIHDPKNWRRGTSKNLLSLRPNDFLSDKWVWIPSPLAPARASA